MKSLLAIILSSLLALTEAQAKEALHTYTGSIQHVDRAGKTMLTIDNAVFTIGRNLRIRPLKSKYRVRDLQEGMGVYYQYKKSNQLGDPPKIVFLEVQEG